MGKTFYEKAYAVLKKLPVINAVIIALGIGVFGVVDVIELLTPIGDLDVAAGIFIWILIAAVMAFCAYFATAIKLSATILRTDAVREMLNVLKNDTNGTSNNQAHSDAADDEELPEI